VKQWQNKASKNEKEIRNWWSRWPSANVCIVTGKDSGVVVIDVDPRHGGEESLKELQSSGSNFDGSPSLRTGGGGSHFYFQHPGGRVPNRAGVLPGIDVRGDGGFVVAPPSMHASGEVYSWNR